MGLVLKSRELIRFLESKGFRFVRSRGSHHVYTDDKHTLPVPVHKGKDISEELIKLILNEAGFTKKELLKYLGRQ